LEFAIALSYLELTKRRSAWEKRRKKWAVKKAPRIKHHAGRVNRRLEDLTFGAFDALTSAIKSFNGVVHISVLFRICATNGNDFI